MTAASATSENLTDVVSFAGRLVTSEVPDADVSSAVSSFLTLVLTTYQMLNSIDLSKLRYNKLQHQVGILTIKTLVKQLMRTSTQMVRNHLLIAGSLFQYLLMTLLKRKHQ